MNSIGLCRVAHNSAEELTGNAYRLTYIFLQANLAKEIYQDVKRPLES